MVWLWSVRQQEARVPLGFGLSNWVNGNAGLRWGKSEEVGHLAFGFGHVTLEVSIQWAGACEWIWSVDFRQRSGLEGQIRLISTKVLPRALGTGEIKATARYFSYHGPSCSIRRKGHWHQGRHPVLTGPHPLSPKAKGINVLSQLSLLGSQMHRVATVWRREKSTGLGVRTWNSGSGHSTWAGSH